MLVLQGHDLFVGVILLESDGVSRFTLREGDRTLFSFSYETPDLTGTLAGIVAFVDEEDYDYLLHVHKVLANTERRGLVWLDRS